MAFCGLRFQFNRVHSLKIYFFISVARSYSICRAEIALSFQANLTIKSDFDIKPFLRRRKSFFGIIARGEISHFMLRAARDFFLFPASALYCTATALASPHPPDCERQERRKKNAF